MLAKQANVQLYQNSNDSSIIVNGTGTVLAVGDAAPRHWVLDKVVCFVSSAKAALVVDARCDALLPNQSLLSFY